MKKALRAVSYGEILWDVFPDGKKLGGAPLNLCLRMKSLGVSMKIISRLGKDALAQETLDALHDFNLDQKLIQQDEQLATGQVLVKLDKNGSASYEIKKPVAWDAIQLTEANQKAVAAADLFIFGSLAARCETSRQSLKALLSLSKYAVFDVNMRAPHYELKDLVWFMQQAQLVKMNDEELLELASHLGIKSADMEPQLEAVSKATGVSRICVTCGKDGAMLYDTGIIYKHPGFPTKVIDTVGAGDSFLAGLLHQLFMAEQKPGQALAFACALGALVAGKKGANPAISLEEIQAKMLA